jgi:uncharacterized membrane protein
MRVVTVAREDRPRQRIDQPKDQRRALALPTYDPETWARVAERFARFLGTWKFIGYMSLFIAAWVVWNIVGPHDLTFDTYSNKFTLLTLLLSLQASYAAPLILLAQNRQADRDRVQYEQDRALSVRGVEDAEYLAREVAAIRVALGEVATRDYIRGELQRLVEELAASGLEEESLAD